MTVKEVKDFLSNIQPFKELDDTVLSNIAGGVIIEFYPKDTLILQQDGPPSDFLRIIKKGGVKVFIRSDRNEEVVIDYRSEGDSFGLLSLIGGDKSRANVKAVEDTICYLATRETIQGLLDSNAAFSEYFLKSFLNKYIDKTFSEMHSKSLLYGGGDKLLFTTSVGELATKHVTTAPQEISIRNAAAVMSEQGISSLVLVDPESVPAGIVTDRDLRDKVVSKDRSTNDPIRSIMSVPLMKVEAGDYCFEALLKMIRFNIHHLLVVDEGRLKGIITNHDLMMMQGTSPLSVVREIESQQTVEGLVPVSREINRIVTLLLREGAKASNITKIITEINDRLIRKIIEIAESKFGEAPVRYCWIVFGSEGRKEQTFKTDQDNAIIFEDSDTPERQQAAVEYFETFAEFVKESLLTCGFPVCPGNYMASNPMWRQPLSVWKEYFTNWIYAPTTEAILFSAILFDFRPVYGDSTLGEKLRGHLTDTLVHNEIFLKHMANMSVSLRPPLGFFKTFVVEKSGEHRDELNLKFKCIAPLINIVRLFSLEKGITVTSTIERIEALKEVHAGFKEYGDELEHAFEFMNLLRIHHQIEQIEKGIEPDHFVNPDHLSSLEKKTLKEACQLISTLQDSITKQYNPGTVM